MSVYLYLTLHDPMDCSSPGSSMRFSRQEYWSGLPFPPPADPPDQRTEPASVASPALARWQSDSFTTVLPGKPADTTPARTRAHTHTHTHTHTHRRWSPLEMFTVKLSTREWDRKQWFLLKYIIGYTVLFDQRNKNKTTTTKTTLNHHHY